MTSRSDRLSGEPAAWVYMLASGRNGTLYVGMTTNLPRRVWQHKHKLTPGFTSDYDVTILVWYEGYDSIVEARQREHVLKRWRRAWKMRLIEEFNPCWRDLYPELI